MMTTREAQQVWIGCLAAYNAGRLHGKWVDAYDADEMEEAAKEVIRTSPAWQLDGHAEEWFIADYNAFPHSVVGELGEYASFETVANVANALQDHGDTFAAWLETQDSGLDLSDTKLVERFQEEYRGDYDSEEAYAMEYACELGWSGLEGSQIEEIASYIDWESVARELFDHGTYTLEQGHVFEQM
jgi:antirestriction protein